MQLKGLGRAALHLFGMKPQEQPRASSPIPPQCCTPDTWLNIFGSSSVVFSLLVSWVEPAAMGWRTVMDLGRGGQHQNSQEIVILLVKSGHCEALTPIYVVTISNGFKQGLKQYGPWKVIWIRRILQCFCAISAPKFPLSVCFNANTWCDEHSKIVSCYKMLCILINFPFFSLNSYV